MHSLQSLNNLRPSLLQPTKFTVLLRCVFVISWLRVYYLIKLILIIYIYGIIYISVIMVSIHECMSLCFYCYYVPARFHETVPLVVSGHWYTACRHYRDNYVRSSRQQSRW